LMIIFDFVEDTPCSLANILELYLNNNTIILIFFKSTVKL